MNDLKLTSEFLFETEQMSARDGRRIGWMWGKYGKREGEICRGCQHFLGRQTPAGHHYSKCRMFGISSGPATDWNGRFQACGLFTACGGTADAQR